MKAPEHWHTGNGRVAAHNSHINYNAKQTRKGITRHLKAGRHSLSRKPYPATYLYLDCEAIKQRGLAKIQLLGWPPKSLLKIPCLTDAPHIPMSQLRGIHIVDAIGIQHIGERHNAFQLVNICPVNYGQDIEMILAHAFQG